MRYFYSAIILSLRGNPENHCSGQKEGVPGGQEIDIDTFSYSFRHYDRKLLFLYKKNPIKIIFKKTRKHDGILIHIAAYLM